MLSHVPVFNVCSLSHFNLLISHPFLCQVLPKIQAIESEGNLIGVELESPIDYNRWAWLRCDYAVTAWVM